MKFRSARSFALAVTLAHGCAVLAAAQNASSSSSPPSSVSAADKAFHLDAQTPQGLRDLFKPTGEALPILSAHRGGAGRGLPENCMATFAATVAHGWSLLEIDLRTTKDGVIVLMHDPTLDRTSNGTGAIKDRTLAELRELRLKDRDGKLTEHRIPTLDEAMKWARGKTILMLDKKEVPVKEVVRVVTEHRAESYAMMLAYTAAEAKECHTLNPEVMMEVMLGTRERFEEFARTGVRWSNVIAFVGHTATPDLELCRQIREKGASCMAGSSRNIDREFLTGRVSTVEPLREKYRALLERGVDVIETDIPRDVASVVHGGKAPTGTKAKFFRVVGG
jgi:glycerophosphoryl diester phosphodiesterase